MSTPKLTDKRLRILKSAASHKLGLVANPFIQGFERVSWTTNADYLVGFGLLRRYVHGGYEITETGRNAAQIDPGRLVPKHGSGP
jgi:hypothetical protein